jgi:NAD(P)-dependent dehydrogenase (short-subunit alcohol dehydrogenase family)
VRLPAVCLVTGANSGIGFEVARGLARTGARVLLACRDQGRGEAARSAIAREFRDSEVELVLVDLASQRAIRSAAREISERHPRLDVLVNNAGVGIKSQQVSPDGIELTFATNVLAYYMLPLLLMDSLRRAPSARVVNVASKFAGGLNLDDLEFQRRPYEAMAAYMQSKQANRMLTWALVRRLEDVSVTANAMAPGPTNTPLLRAFAPGASGRTPAEGADTVIWLAASPEVEGVSGRFWADRREERCEFRSEADEEALWALCERMTEGTSSW